MCVCVGGGGGGNDISTGNLGYDSFRLQLFMTGRVGSATAGKQFFHHRLHEEGLSPIYIFIKEVKSIRKERKKERKKMKKKRKRKTIEGLIPNSISLS